MRGLQRLPFVLVIWWGMLSVACANDSISPLKVTVDVEPKSARVAEPIRVSLSVIAPRGSDVLLTKPPRDLLEPLELRDDRTRRDWPLPDQPDLRLWSAEWIVETTRTGSWQIPPLDVRYRTAGSETWQQLRTSPIDIEIESLLEQRADPLEFRDIKPAVNVVPPSAARRGPWAWWAWWAAGAVLLAAALAVLVWRRRRRRSPSPRELALAAIGRLEQRHRSGSISAAEVCGSLSSILRALIQATAPMPAVTSTTEELSDWAAGNSPLNRAHQAVLVELLQRADRVRFARLEQDRGQIGASIVQAQALVEAWPTTLPQRRGEAA